jgi:hypothetical protein
MNRRLYSYWRVGIHECGNTPAERITTAKRRAPKGYTYHGTTKGQYVFRKPLPVHEREARIYADAASNDARSPY